MKIIQDVGEWRHIRQELPHTATLGFVPTMGNLHPGHASLVVSSRQENDLTAVSIFVNPTQFNNADDFNHYPRTLTEDIELLIQNGVDFCLIPDEKALYPEGYRFQIQETLFSNQMEGQHRPGHFCGVFTVVMKLLNLIKPSRAYFGEKDYQQYCLIRDMANDFFMDIEIKSCPTIREPSGLAFSSRNNRLDFWEKKLAVQFAQIFQQGKSTEDIISALRQLNIEIDYVKEYQKRRFAAVKIGNVRLIDNYALADEESTSGDN
ncbi:pantoate--beta-alanine ligase [Legionella londiniensis]|uniref:Pantothenate synthetase n=1 Tax=Legionella londiniensis TaxID=45068 RepID=A0A0W0VSE8_9GAMM|nr:pantoate--beta-alanine ligase [Legionella londiniensis]KTD23043.1 pantoate-beta-alanine ligase [Legionella londiniensis]STX94060.1 pantoate--beta-alanine ligase [Legionella londiniensis]